MPDGLSVGEIYLEKRLALRNILIEKILMGVVVGFAGFIGSMLLEDYKKDLEQERYLVRARLTAIEELRTLYGKMQYNLHRLAHMEKPPSDEFIEKYGSQLQEFLRISNTKVVLFSEEIEKELQKHVLIHQAAASGKLKISPEDLEYIYDVFDHFGNITRIALLEEGFSVGAASPESDFAPESWSEADIAQKGPVKYFEESREQWSRFKKEQSGNK